MTAEAGSPNLIWGMIKQHISINCVQSACADRFNVLLLWNTCNVSNKRKKKNIPAVCTKVKNYKWTLMVLSENENGSVCNIGPHQIKRPSGQNRNVCTWVRCCEIYSFVWHVWKVQHVHTHTHTPCELCLLMQRSVLLRKSHVYCCAVIVYSRPSRRRGSDIWTRVVGWIKKERTVCLVAKNIFT